MHSIHDVPKINTSSQNRSTVYTKQDLGREAGKILSANVKHRSLLFICDRLLTGINVVACFGELNLRIKFWYLLFWVNVFKAVALTKNCYDIFEIYIVMHWHVDCLWELCFFYFSTFVKWWWSFNSKWYYCLLSVFAEETGEYPNRAVLPLLVICGCKCFSLLVFIKVVSQVRDKAKNP